MPRRAWRAPAGARGGRAARRRRVVVLRGGRGRGARPAERRRREALEALQADAPRQAIFSLRSDEKIESAAGTRNESSIIDVGYG